MSENTKDIIINAAIELIAEEGEKGFTAGKVSQKVGISKAGLFHHFPSMRELDLAIMETFVDSAAGEFLHGAKSFDNARDFVVSMGQLNLDYLDSHPKMIKVMARYVAKALIDPELTSRMKSYYQKYQSHISNIFKSYALEDSEKLATIFILSLDAFGLNYIMTRDRKALLEAWQKLSELFV